MGYRYGLRILQNEGRQLLNWASQDKLLPVKFAYLLDKTFQNFVSELSDFIGADNPIQSARRYGLGDFMRDGINIALGGYKYGSIPNLVLPSSLAQSPSADKTEDKKPKASSDKTSPDPGASPGWWSTNPGVVKEWKVPSGKNYSL